MERSVSSIVLTNIEDLFLLHLDNKVSWKVMWKEASESKIQVKHVFSSFKQVKYGFEKSRSKSINSFYQYPWMSSDLQKSYNTFSLIIPLELRIFGFYTCFDFSKFFIILLVEMRRLIYSYIWSWSNCSKNMLISFFHHA